MAVKRPGQGLNKEKLVFLVCLLLLGASGFYFFISRPEMLGAYEPLTSQRPPDKYEAQERGSNPDFTYEVKGRKSAFMPYTEIAEAQPVKVPLISNRPKPLPDPPPQTVARPPVKQVFTPREKDLEVAFRGVSSTSGHTVALLEKKDGTGYLRVKVGDTIEGLNYKISRIEPQAIYLDDAEGRPYVLKDGRFMDGGSGSSGGSTTPKSSPPAPGPSTPDPPAPTPKSYPKGKDRSKP